jgi:Uma2 family endonuclease
MVAITDTRSQPKSSIPLSSQAQSQERGSAIEPTNVSEIIYPSSDGEPLAETQEHSLAILIAFSILRQYFQDQQAVVFANQFFYYIEKKPRARVAPDVMVVFDIPVKLYSNYKLWEGQQTPAIIFEITSVGTKENDWNFKKLLYEQLGIQEYWLFDPYGEWVPEQLQGYRLNEDGLYKLITDSCSEVLQLRLQVEDYLIGFYRLDNNEKLLTPDELFIASQEASQRAEEASQRAQFEKTRGDRLEEKLRALGVDPDGDDL